MYRNTLTRLLLFISYLVTVSAGDNSYVINLNGRPEDGFYLNINLGTPIEAFNVLLDTGSSNFAIAAYNDPSVTTFFHSSNSTTYDGTDNSVHIRYTEGSWNGVLGSDMVSFPSEEHLSARVDIALILDSSNFFVNMSNWQGILGLGYKAIALADRKEKPTPFIDSFVDDNLFKDSFSLLLCPAQDNSSLESNSSKFVLGSADKSLYTGDMYKAKVVVRGFYQVLLTDIRINGISLDMDCIEYNSDKTIVDSGTTSLRLPVSVFNKVVSLLKQKALVSNIQNEDFWRGKEAACWSNHEFLNSTIYDLFPAIALDLYHGDGHVFTLNVAPQQYLRPYDSVDKPQQLCYKIEIASSTTGTVLGAVIMEGYYVLFDRENSTVSFANAECKHTTTTVHGYSTNPRATLTSCLYKKAETTSLPAYAIALIAICAFLFVIFVIVIFKFIRHRTKKHRRLQNDLDFHNLVDNTFDTEY